MGRAVASLQASSGGVVRQRQENGVGQFAWALFDWANSPFNTLIITFVFPAYFATAIIGDQVRGQAIWGYAIGASGLVVALLSPPLGAIADVGGRRKPWIVGFALVSIVATALLWFAAPAIASAPLALACIVIANVGVALGTMFNNALLPDIVTRERLGRLSAWAWDWDIPVVWRRAGAWKYSGETSEQACARWRVEHPGKDPDKAGLKVMLISWLNPQPGAARSMGTRQDGAATGAARDSELKPDP